MQHKKSWDIEVPAIRIVTESEESNLDNQVQSNQKE